MKITLWWGCFWCLEAVFQKFGLEVKSWYMAWEKADEKILPSYENVSNWNGYIEVVQINFDQKQIELSSILEIFFQIHDPTTKARQ